MLTVAIVGTRAQAIKMAPVVQALRQCDLRCELVLTGQHKETVDELLADFDLKTDYRLWNTAEVSRIASAAWWSVIALWRCWVHMRARQKRERVVVLVHGDTITTLIGTIASRLSGLDVAHVEAGLRSGALGSPFPEEIIRRTVTRMAQIAYCPGDVAYNAVGRKAIRRIDTVENTVLDALRLAVPDCYESHRLVKTNPYVIVSAHRVETVLSHKQLGRLVEIVTQISESIRVKFVLHPITEQQLVRSGQYSRLNNNPSVELVPRMGYKDFIRLTVASDAVLTDGGSNQEEMAYLGVPTLLLRRRTERHHGLGHTCHLVGLDVDQIRGVLKTARLHPYHLGHYTANPSATIAEDLGSYYDL